MTPIVRERFRVPRENRSACFRPEPAELPHLVLRNRSLLDSYDFALAGRPFRQFRAAARAEVVDLARRYTARWGVTAPEWAEPKPIVLSGHQPSPYHPGVWIKNFLAGSLAEAVGGTAINLNVDNDQPHQHAVRLPACDLTCRMGGDEVRVVEVPFAPQLGGVAYEEQSAAAIRPEAAEELLDLVPSPALAAPFRRFWTLLGQAAPDAANLGEAFVVARRRLEESLGLRNLELPVSCLADSKAFLLFVAGMAARHEAFFVAYNDSLREFRRVYRERSPAQPVPDLARDGARMELPFWVWRAGEPRRRLWVEPGGRGGLLLTCDHGRVGRLTAGEAADAAGGAARLAALRRAGWKIRPRALSMTLFVRLCVGDVFIHGLGGALYDKITDAMIERLFGVRPPGLAMASCTVHLPLETHPETREDLAAAERAVRDWRYNADRMLPESLRGRDEVGALIDEKRRLVETRGTDRVARRRIWRRIRAINAELEACSPDGTEQAWRRLRNVARALRYNAILTNREYPFFLHPIEDLVAFYREAVRIPVEKGQGERGRRRAATARCCCGCKESGEAEP